MRALVTGATGFIGPHLLRRLERPVVLSRDARETRVLWRNSTSGVRLESPDWTAAAGSVRRSRSGVSLGGRSGGQRSLDPEKKQRIRQSRELGTRHLVQTLQQMQQRPRVLVSASATGWYGNRGDEILNESALPANDFLAEVCVAWEREARAAEP